MGAQEKTRFERLARDNSPAIANYLRRRLYPLNSSDLDDLVEEVLIIVWRRIDNVPADAETAWIIGVARNVLQNARRKKNRATAFETALRPVMTESSAEDAVVADAAITEALMLLGPEEREILMLHFWDGLSSAQIAHILGTTENAAAVRLSRSLAQFRQHLLVDERP
jgi:RNA polymerase sigma-70 factor (ECF subfamily)